MKSIALHTPEGSPKSEAGFSLLEVMIAMSILMVGLFGMAQVFYLGLSIAVTSTPNLIAREKAREAVESVHTARDTHTILWSQIRNEEQHNRCPEGMTGTGGGVFVNDADPLKSAGLDGIVGTSDDAGTEMSPGPDGVFGEDEEGNSDDLPLAGYTRQIDICDVDANEDLRQIVVIIRYESGSSFGARQREYRLTTFISRIS